MDPTDFVRVVKHRRIDPRGRIINVRAYIKPKPRPHPRR